MDVSIYEFECGWFLIWLLVDICIVLISYVLAPVCSYLTYNRHNKYMCNHIRHLVGLCLEISVLRENIGPETDKPSRRVDNSRLWSIEYLSSDVHWIWITWNGEEKVCMDGSGWSENEVIFWYKRTSLQTSIKSISCKLKVTTTVHNYSSNRNSNSSFEDLCVVRHVM